MNKYSTLVDELSESRQARSRQLRDEVGVVTLTRMDGSWVRNWEHQKLGRLGTSLVHECKCLYDIHIIISMVLLSAAGTWGNGCDGYLYLMSIIREGAGARDTLGVLFLWRMMAAWHSQSRNTVSNVPGVHHQWHVGVYFKRETPSPRGIGIRVFGLCSFFKEI